MMGFKARALGAPVPARVLAPALMLTLALTSCSASIPFQGEAFAMLDAEPSTVDELPTVIIDDAQGVFDPESSRLAAVADGATFWLARGSERNTICLIMRADDSDDWYSGCGQSRLEISNDLGDFLVQPDGFLPPTDATQLSPNVYRQNSPLASI